MAFGKLFKSLLGGEAPPTISDDPFGRKPPPAAPRPPPPARPPRPLASRDEIIDARSRIAGYRFRVARGTADAAAVAAALRDENLATFAQRRLALVPLTATEWRQADFRPLIAPHAVFLLDPPPRDGDAAEWLASAHEIRDAGARLGIDGIAAATHAEAFGVADLVLLDFRAHALPDFERLAKSFGSARPQVELAADGVGAWAEHRLCLSLGLRYSLGGFAAEPDAAEAREQIDQSRLVLIEMLNLLRREADLTELAQVARRDPAVAVKVLGMVNSPAAGLGRPVASIDQAIMLLGRDTLYRWLTVSMFRAGSGSPRDETLLELALSRARFLELTALGLRPKAESDELFLVGMLSFIDSLLGMPLDKALAPMRLPEHVAAALLRSDGPYRRHLMLALAIEKGRDDLVGRIAGELALGIEAVSEARVAALAWAEEALGGI